MGKLVFAPLGGQDHGDDVERHQRDRESQPWKGWRIDGAIAERGGEQIQAGPPGRDDGQDADELGAAQYGCYAVKSALKRRGVLVMLGVEFERLTGWSLRYGPEGAAAGH